MSRERDRAVVLMLQWMRKAASLSRSEHNVDSSNLSVPPSIISRALAARCVRFSAAYEIDIHNFESVLL